MVKTFRHLSPLYHLSSQTFLTAAAEGLFVSVLYVMFKRLFSHVMVQLCAIAENSFKSLYLN